MGNWWNELQLCLRYETRIRADNKLTSSTLLDCVAQHNNLVIHFTFFISTFQHTDALASFETSRMSAFFGKLVQKASEVVALVRFPHAGGVQTSPEIVFGLSECPISR